MAPCKQPSSLATLSLDLLQNLIVEIVRNDDHIFFEVNAVTNEVKETVEESVREDVLEYIGKMLPGQLTSTLIIKLIQLTDFINPHLIIEILFSETINNLFIELTDAKNVKEVELGIKRISEDDIRKTLDSILYVFEKTKKGFEGLQSLIFIDDTEDPDFQGDPINNLVNTNAYKDIKKNSGRRGIMSRLTSLSLHLSTCVTLTKVILPFISDCIVLQISHCESLRHLQNIYRSTLTDTGLQTLAEGPTRHSLVRVILSLNAHSDISSSCLQELLVHCPRLRILELGGALNTKSLYFQGGDARRRAEVFRAVARLPEKKRGECQLAKMLIFVENEEPVALSPLVSTSASLRSLILFSWEHIMVLATEWSLVAHHLDSLELVGHGFNEVGLSPSSKLDLKLLSEAASLRSLRLAGWGDTQVPLDEMLEALPRLEDLYLEDVKLSVTTSGPGMAMHSLERLTLFHCSTREVGLLSVVPRLLPELAHLRVSSLYLDDSVRGLPFQFHLPDLGAEVPRLPEADLYLLAKMTSLQTLHLNVFFPSKITQHDFSLPRLIIRDFPSLKILVLDNFLIRSSSTVSYAFQREAINKKISWLLQQYNRDVQVTIN